MVASRPLCLAYITLLSALCAVAAPVDHTNVTLSLEARVGPMAGGGAAGGMAAGGVMKGLMEKLFRGGATPAAPKSEPKPEPAKDAPAKPSASAVPAKSSSAAASSSPTPAPSSSAANSLSASPTRVSVRPSAKKSRKTCDAKKKKKTAPAAKVARELLPRAPLTGSEEHQVSLIRYFKGTEHEHWALFFHPSQPDATGAYTGTRVDAVTDAGAARNSVLVQDEETKKFRPDGVSRTMTTIATVENGAAATALLNRAKRAKLRRPPPEENCVDWTNLAVQAMGGRTRGSLSPDLIAVYQFEYMADKEGVRDRTACNFACSPVPEGA